MKLQTPTETTRKRSASETLAGSYLAALPPSAGVRMVKLMARGLNNRRYDDCLKQQAGDDLRWKLQIAEIPRSIESQHCLNAARVPHRLSSTACPSSFSAGRDPGSMESTAPRPITEFRFLIRDPGPPFPELPSVDDELMLAACLLSFMYRILLKGYTMAAFSPSTRLLQCSPPNSVCSLPS